MSIIAWIVLGLGGYQRPPPAAADQLVHQDKPSR
jgi:hypothetical protein